MSDPRQTDDGPIEWPTVHDADFEKNVGKRAAPDPDAGRLRLYMISPELIITFLGGWRKHEYAALPNLDLPAGFEVRNVTFAFEYNAFAVAIWHPTFEPVQPGRRIPDATSSVHLTQQAFRIPLGERDGPGDPMLRAAVDRAATALLSKLKKAEEKYGLEGDEWRLNDWADELRRNIREHVEKGDPLDVMAYAIMAYTRGWSLAIPSPGPMERLRIDIAVAEGRLKAMQEQAQAMAEVAANTGRFVDHDAPTPAEMSRFVGGPDGAVPIAPGGEAAGPNPDYRPPVMAWNVVEVLAPEGFSFAIVGDSGGCLGLDIRPPGGEWTSGLARTGENTIAPGHRAYVVRNDGQSGRTDGPA